MGNSKVWSKYGPPLISIDGKLNDNLFCLLLIYNIMDNSNPSVTPVTAGPHPQLFAAAYNVVRAP